MPNKTIEVLAPQYADHDHFIVTQMGSEVVSAALFTPGSDVFAVVTRTFTGKWALEVSDLLVRTSRMDRRRWDSPREAFAGLAWLAGVELVEVASC